MAGQPTCPRYPLRNKGLIAGLRGNQWFISSDHMALFPERVGIGGVPLDSITPLIGVK